MNSRIEFRWHKSLRVIAYCLLVASLLFIWASVNLSPRDAPIMDTLIAFIVLFVVRTFVAAVFAWFQGKRISSECPAEVFLPSISICASIVVLSVDMISYAEPCCGPS